MATSRAEILIRRLVLDDLPSALSIQAANYPPFLQEGTEAFASRLAVPASYCLAAVREESLIAYLLAHGWPAQEPPPVGAVLRTDAAGEVLYIHDLAVSAEGRGAGLGRRLFDHAFELAGRNGIRSAELIAVEGAAGYWSALGFAEGAPPPDLAAKVSAYGARARWMTRDAPPLSTRAD